LGFVAENDVILAGIVRQLEAMESSSGVVRVRYNSRAKSYNFAPSESVASSHLQPWIEVELDDGQLLRTKLLVSSDTSL